jgi:hypothetical protein
MSCYPVTYGETPNTIEERTEVIGEQLASIGERLVSNSEWVVSMLAAIQYRCDLVIIYSGLLKNFRGPLKIQM